MSIKIYLVPLLDCRLDGQLTSLDAVHRIISYAAIRTKAKDFLEVYNKNGCYCKKRKKKRQRLKEKNE